MDSLWQILVQFIFRVTFGVALAMAVTSPREVTSGYYRVHLWVLMGLNTFATLAVWNAWDSFGVSLASPTAAAAVFVFAVMLAIVSYLGAVVWLYEMGAVGRKILLAISIIGFVAAVLAAPVRVDAIAGGRLMAALEQGSSGLLLGATLAAMFLGHWYLNTPTMQLGPLKSLVLLMAAAIVARGLVCGVGLGAQLGWGAGLPPLSWAFVAMRWLAGIVGTLLMAIMAWQTLKIPNTQSATGILYAGVILAFIGELTSQLLSVSAAYPL